MNKNNAEPVLGLIMLDTQFPRIKGDVGNPETFDFPVMYEKVSGATAKRVVNDADEKLLEPFIDAARRLEQRGATLISTSCGFLAMFQQALNDAVHVPVLSSSLLQLHTAGIMLKAGKKPGILTISSDSLTESHFSSLGLVRRDFPIIGMDPASEFSSVFLGNKTVLDEQKCTQEIVTTAQQFIAAHPDVGAIVLECTNMPPYADAIRQATGMAVFDVVTMLNYAHSALSG